MQLVRKRVNSTGDSEVIFVSGRMKLLFTDMKIRVIEAALHVGLCQNELVKHLPNFNANSTSC
jgi:alpha-acetolactate decarboxylase